MKSSMKMRSAERITKLENGISKLETSMYDISQVLSSITLELKKISESKTTPTECPKDDTSVKTKVLEQLNVEEDSSVTVIDRVRNPMEYIKLYNHYSTFFQSASLHSNFRNYDHILKFIVENEQKFAYHGVPSNFKVKMFLKRIEGSSVITEFFRHTKLKREDDNSVSSNDIETWDWQTFKSDFISLFIDSGAIYNIIDTLTSWKVGMFKRIKESVDAYENLMKFMREINLIKGGESNLSKLKNDFKIHLLRTIDCRTHDEVVTHMEINYKLESKIVVIHDIDYQRLVEILIVIETKREISNSLYDKHNKSHQRTNQQWNDNSAEVYKKMPCHQFAADNCTLGEKCLYSHEKNIINEYKKSIGERADKK